MSNRSCRSDTSEKKYFRRLSLWQNCVGNKWIAKWGMRGLFHNHLIFPPFPTAIWWEKYFFFCAVMTRLCQLGVEVPWKVRSIIGSAFAMSGLWQNQVKWGIQDRRTISPSLSSTVSVLCHADNDFLCTSEGMSSQAQLNNLPTGYAAVDFAMTAIPWIVP